MRIVHQNFVYFCSDACAGKLTIQSQGSEFFSTAHRASHAVVETAAVSTPVPAQAAAESEQVPLLVPGERVRAVCASMFAMLGMYARSATWTEWAYAMVVYGVLLVATPYARWQERAALPARASLGLYTCTLALGAYAAAIFSASWLWCLANVLLYVYVALRLGALHLPAWLEIFAAGEYTRKA